MTRHRERRSFTVAAKSSGHHGFVSIPAKAPRIPQTPARAAPSTDVWDAPPAAAPAADVAPRRVLQSLIAWEAPAPEPDLGYTPEPPLPRVRRASPQVTLDEAPRRRGRPRKLPLAVETPPAPPPQEQAPVVPAPPVETAASVPAAKPAQRRARPDGAGLRLGERWKRRLPRSCW